MESRPDSAAIDPYAPPKAEPLDADATYLDQDGYAFKNELVTNKYFKPPLICAKLGISLENEENLKSTLITIGRIPKFKGLVQVLVYLFYFCLIAFMFTHGIILLSFVIIYLLKNYLFSTPYQIPFYFSKRYKAIRKRYLTINLCILIILTTGFIYGIQSGNIAAYNSIATPCALSFLALLFFLKTKHFTINKSKGDFVYLHGAHPDFLKALPQLPLSAKPPTSEKPSI